MGKDERERHGFRRMTAYSVTEGYRLKAVAPFLKREHGVKPRVFDEAMYAVSLKILHILLRTIKILNSGLLPAITAGLYVKC